jgi:hypothetical protein
MPKTITLSVPSASLSLECFSTGETDVWASMFVQRQIGGSQDDGNTIAGSTRLTGTQYYGFWEWEFSLALPLAEFLVFEKIDHQRQINPDVQIVLRDEFFPLVGVKSQWHNRARFDSATVGGETYWHCDYNVTLLIPEQYKSPIREDWWRVNFRAKELI